jgi:hypothetical protein
MPNTFRITRKVGPSPREQVLAHLRTAGVPALDLMEALRAGKARDRLFIENRSHWNDLGALFGYQQIIAAVASNFPRCGRSRRRISGSSGGWRMAATWRG